MKYNLCDRCGKESTVTLPGKGIVRLESVFNNQWLCGECKMKEFDHPKFREAVKAHRKAMKVKNYGFLGIGLPEDLQVNRGDKIPHE